MAASNHITSRTAHLLELMTEATRPSTPATLKRWTPFTTRT